MGRASKPWLNYKSDAPEREYFEPPRKKRKLGWALFWLIVGGHWGAHRLYLWDGKKAILIIAVFLLMVMLIPLLLVGILSLSEENAIGLAPFIPWVMIILFELPRLKARVQTKNKEYLLNI